MCGEGKLINSNGDESYKGNFDKNEFNGKGTYSYQNGDRYEGNFEYGIKRGEGRYFRNDDVEFEGFWNNDLPNGNGIITYRGNSLKGFWRNGISQMKSCVCKINLNDGKQQNTGFFCKIPYPDQAHLLSALVTCNFIIGKENLKEGNTIRLSLNDDKEFREIKIIF